MYATPRWRSIFQIIAKIKIPKFSSTPVTIQSDDDFLNSIEISLHTFLSTFNQDRLCKYVRKGRTAVLVFEEHK